MLTETTAFTRPLSVEPERGDAILVCLLGSFRLLRHGRPLDLLVAGKAMALLSALALRLDQGVPREALLETLWPDQDPGHSSVSLHSLVYSLQRRLRGESGDGTAIAYAHGAYYLNTAAGHSTDIVRFDALIAAGNRLVAVGREAAASSHYERAVALYRGDLCTAADVSAVIERERLRASVLTVLAWLADRACRDGQHPAALGYAQRLLAYDPCREDAYRVVMRVHVRQGERAEALHQYRLCEQILRREFDAVPEAPTRDLFDRIRVDPASV